MSDERDQRPPQAPRQPSWNEVVEAEHEAATGFLRNLGPGTQDRIDGMGDDTAWDEAIARAGTLPPDDGSLRRRLINKAVAVWRQRSDEQVTASPAEHCAAIVDALLPTITGPEGSDEATLHRQLQTLLKEHRHNGRIEVWETVCRCSWGGLNDPVENFQVHQVDALMPAIREYVAAVVSTHRQSDDPAQGSDR